MIKEIQINPDNNTYVLDKPVNSIMLCNAYYWVDWLDNPSVTLLYPEDNISTLIFKNQLPQAKIGIKSDGIYKVFPFIKPYNLKIEFKSNNIYITAYDEDNVEITVTLKDTTSALLTIERNTYE